MNPRSALPILRFPTDSLRAETNYATEGSSGARVIQTIPPLQFDGRIGAAPITWSHPAN